MELALIFATSFVVGLSGAMMPGPLLTVTIDESVRRGFRAGLLPVLGHGIAEILVVIGLTLGLSQLVQAGIVKGTIGLLGGLVLLWMAYGMGQRARQGKLSLSTASTGVTHGPGPVPAGALVSVSNPYWLLWWATIGAAYVASAMQWGATGLAVFFGGHILSDLAWLSLVAGVIVTGRRVLNDSIYRGLILVCALFLVGLGFYFVVSGVGFLRG
ncbi:MAG: LysE family transporter [Chloroflexota bacterium]